MTIRRTDLLVLGAVLLTLLFLPCENLWMGDAYTFAHLVKEFNLQKVVALPDGSFFAEPLTLPVIWAIGDPAQVSYLCGVFYLGIVGLMVRDLGRGFLMFAVLPIIQVFAGYIEIYALAYTLTLLTIWAYLTRRDGVCILAGVLAFLAHILVGLPAVVLALVRMDLENSIPTALVIAGYVLFCKLTFPVREGRALMPWSGPYTMLGAFHLVEIGVYLLASSGWVMLAGYLPKSKLDPGLATASIVGLGLMGLILPMAGMFRYFDVMGMAVLPVTALLVVTTSFRWRALFVQGAVTLGFLIFNSADRQAAMFSIMDSHPAYRADFQDGHQLEVTRFIYWHELGRQDLARELGD